jgi:ATP-dependent Clp protease ATP-binding subunit ClpC
MGILPMDLRFTNHARKVMQLANAEAQRCNHESIGTEHILLGLTKEDSGLAANLLKSLGYRRRTIRLEVEKLLQNGPNMNTIGKLPQRPLAKRVIENSFKEAEKLNHSRVGTGHILLALLCTQEGIAFQVLTNLGLRVEEVRAQLEVVPERSEDEGNLEESHE